MLVVLPVCEAGSFEGRMCASWVRARARKRKRWWLGSRARARTQTDVAVVPSVLVMLHDGKWYYCCCYSGWCCVLARLRVFVVEAMLFLLVCLFFVRFFLYMFVSLFVRWFVSLCFLLLLLVLLFVRCCCCCCCRCRCCGIVVVVLMVFFIVLIDACYCSMISHTEYVDTTSEATNAPQPDPSWWKKHLELRQTRADSSL